MRLPTAAVLALAVWAAPAAADERTDLGKAIERWSAAGPEDYRWTVAIGCFCPPDVTKPERIKVRDGKAVKPPKRLRPYGTVPKLFALVSRSISEGAAEVRVEYRRSGAPKSIYIDRDRSIADEELSITASKPRR